MQLGAAAAAVAAASEGSGVVGIEEGDEQLPHELVGIRGGRPQVPPERGVLEPELPPALRLLQPADGGRPALRVRGRFAQLSGGSRPDGILGILPAVLSNVSPSTGKMNVPRLRMASISQISNLEFVPRYFDIWIFAPPDGIPSLSLDQLVRGRSRQCDIYIISHHAATTGHQKKTTGQKHKTQTLH